MREELSPLRIVRRSVLGVIVDEGSHLLGGVMLEVVEEHRDIRIGYITELDLVAGHQSNSSTTDAISRF
jgi:hypothetical protein